MAQNMHLHYFGTWWSLSCDLEEAEKISIAFSLGTPSEKTSRTLVLVLLLHNLNKATSVLHGRSLLQYFVVVSKPKNSTTLLLAVVSTLFTHRRGWELDCFLSWPLLFSSLHCLVLTLLTLLLTCLAPQQVRPKKLNGKQSDRCRDYYCKDRRG